MLSFANKTTAILACASLLACGATTSQTVSGSGGTAGAAGSSADAGDSGGLVLDGSGSGCANDSCLVYLFGKDDGFYSFCPVTLEVKLLGYLDCPRISGIAPTPFSMAVDRKGIAWVEYTNGRLYNVDIKTVVCTPTDYEPFQEGFATFGMGFVSDAPGTEEETLYVSDYKGKGLGKIDTQTLKLSVLGSYVQFQGTPGELTGTGSGRLFGFFHPTSDLGNDPPDSVAEIDKTNAELLSDFPQSSVHIGGGGWAFAFWGGDFYLFTSPNGTFSQIDKFNLISGSTATVKTDLQDMIVGAGVSTCAPIKPPA